MFLKPDCTKHFKASQPMPPAPTSSTFDSSMTVKSLGEITPAMIRLILLV